MWKYINHSIVIVGWGFDKETNTKFWICRNSYGPSFGEHGYFRVRRGQNDLAIESQPSAFEPKLIVKETPSS